jgi:hypothetical protein
MAPAQVAIALRAAAVGHERGPGTTSLGSHKSHRMRHGFMC